MCACGEKEVAKHTDWLNKFWSFRLTEKKANFL